MAGGEIGSQDHGGEDLRRDLTALAARVAALEDALQHPTQKPGGGQQTSPLDQAARPPNAARPGAVPGPAPLPPPERSLESRIGSTLLNRIGVVAVMIGAAWFLKLAIDRNWIGPPIRICLGLTVAMGLVVWSERFRHRGFTAFSYSLKALGTGIAYLSLWAAFSVYALVPAGAAFAAMVVVTVANGVLAHFADSELLAA